MKKKSGPLYDNCVICDSNGKFMCFTNRKRIEWYIKKGLATEIDKNKIRLNFKTNGPGNQERIYYRFPMENKCVVCEKNEDLTRHHVVPQCFRKHMSVSVKAHESHDILPLCETCHQTYEIHASKLKKDILDQCFIDTTNPRYHKYIVDFEAKKAMHIAKGLLDFSGQLDIDVELSMLMFLEEFTKKQNLTYEDLKNISNINYETLNADYISPYAEVLKRISCEELILTWRKHFIETMNPQFMPKNWDIYKDINK